ncbi:hypothetical protein A6S26_30270 [Nostoc sp. ATCC 43529]|nr:hypothetical protein A6S26_30270 [Nostoc sp. ATCC 43529]
MKKTANLSASIFSKMSQKSRSNHIKLKNRKKLSRNYMMKSHQKSQDSKNYPDLFVALPTHNMLHALVQNNPVR